jgi:hypothetical protein
LITNGKVEFLIVNATYGLKDAQVRTDIFPVLSRAETFPLSANRQNREKLLITNKRHSATALQNGAYY